MAPRYNAPPNWPAPPAEWTPPSGWEPNSEWGPAPEGWSVWLEDAETSTSVTPPATTYGAQSPQRSSRRRWLWPAIAAVAFLVGIGIGSSSSAKDEPTAAAASESVATNPAEPGPTTTVTQDVAGPVTTETVTAKPPRPKDVIDEGQWEVGSDIKAGTYKLIDAVTGDCYWKISPTGRPGTITDNDIVTGGRPTVTLRKGQDFTNQGCGTWGRK